MVDISIIIVSWNTKDMLRECLESLYKSIVDITFEIIVVDNNSHDGSPEMVQDEFPEVHCIKSDKNLGFARANNEGIKRSSGRYLCLINSDVVVIKDCVNKIHRFMEEEKSVGIAGPKTLNSDGFLQGSVDKFPSLMRNFLRATFSDSILNKFTTSYHNQLAKIKNTEAHKVDILYGSFWIVRKEALSQVGLLDDGFFIYSEDKDWCRRFTDAGWNVMYYLGAEIIHHGGGSSSQAPGRFYIELLRANLQYYKKHYNVLSFLLFLLIMYYHEMVRLLGNLVLYTISPSKKENASKQIRLRSKALFWLFTQNTALMKRILVLAISCCYFAV